MLTNTTIKTFLECITYKIDINKYYYLDIYSVGEEVQVEDSENYGAGEAAGIKGIALEQYRRCIIEGSKEMSRGGTTTKVINGKVIKMEIPNQIDIFVNCVVSLGVILSPEFLEHEEYTEEKDKIEEEESKLKEKGIYAVRNSAKNKSDAVKSYYELLLVNLYRKKLKLYSKLLKEINYYDEGSGIATY